MTKLEKIKKYTEALSKAAKWKNSEEAIINIESIINDNKRHEYIYEFYCALRILSDLNKLYKIRITNNKNLVFPKGPASKINFPYFEVMDKDSGALIMEICLGVDIIGIAGETSAPDISFQKPKCGMIPKFNDVFMLFDAKFKHSLNGKVSDLEFYKVHGMIKNLECEDAYNNKIFSFKELSELLHNCILTNGRAFKSNKDHNILYNLKSVEYFDEDKKYNVYG